MMGVTLSRSPTAAFHANQGLLIEITEGLDNTALTSEFTEPIEGPAFVRFAVNKATLAGDGGDYDHQRLDFFRIHDEYTTSRDHVMNLTFAYFPITQQIQAQVWVPPDDPHNLASSPPTLATNLPAGWHIVTLLIEDQQYTMFLDDNQVAQEAWDFTQSTMKFAHLMLGCLWTDRQLAGQFWLDWITIADRWLANPWYYRHITHLRKGGY